MLTLGVETSCDETAVAVLEDGFTVRSNLIAAQEHLHERFGGVVPEVAARAHVEALNPLLEQALTEAGARFSDLGTVACTVGPGLVGALLVGMAAAKTVALATGARFVGVNHLEGHIWANFLTHGPPEPPYVCLVVSGGHTMLVHMPEVHRYELLGQTLDDAAGEAFDKVARLLGLGFPGGPALDRLAREGDPAAVRFPRPMADSGDLDFSMSGLKTAVLRHVKQEQAAGRAIPAADLAASFQEAIVDVQVAKTIRAATERGRTSVALRLRYAAYWMPSHAHAPRPGTCPADASALTSAHPLKRTSSHRSRGASPRPLGICRLAGSTLKRHDPRP
jgi:N6-L-threonylcarbamoyladenine synthase